ncbi:MAG: FAD-dependent oxidoreductase [Phycisphaerae bacterium]
MDPSAKGSTIQDHYDAIVIGGGTAGVPAAVQASRAGASTLLVERTGQFGGTITHAGIRAIQSFFAHGEAIIAGIGLEWATRTLETIGRGAPSGDLRRPETGVTNTLVPLPVFACIADELLVEAGADLLLHTMLANIEPADEGWRVTLCTKQGLQTVSARTVIDASGDADAVRLAGGEVRESTELQPATLVMQIDGYDPADLDLDAIQEAFEQAVAQGRCKRTDPGWWGGDIRNFLKWMGGNTAHVVGVDGHTSQQRTAAELEGRAVAMRLLRFARTQPGLENYTIEWMAPETGIRESVTIVGRSTVSAEDYLAGKRYDDAIGYAFYPIDVHQPDSVDLRPLEKGVVPSIPFSALLPAETDGLIAAGRTISSDRLANSGLRVMAPCMAMGQAAGAAAALAARTGCSVGEVPIDALRDLLKEHGQIVPGLCPLP